MYFITFELFLKEMKIMLDSTNGNIVLIIIL